MMKLLTFIARLIMEKTAISTTVNRKTKGFLSLMASNPDVTPVHTQFVIECLELAKTSKIIELCENEGFIADSVRQAPSILGAAKDRFETQAKQYGHRTFGEKALTDAAFIRRPEGLEDERYKDMEARCISLGLAIGLLECTRFWTIRSFYELVYKTIPNGQACLDQSIIKFKEASAKWSLPVSRDKGERGVAGFTFANTSVTTNPVNVGIFQEYPDKPVLQVLGMVPQFNRGDFGGAGDHASIRQVITKRLRTPEYDDTPPSPKDELRMEVSKRIIMGNFVPSLTDLLADCYYLGGVDVQQGTAKRQGKPLGEIGRRLIQMQNIIETQAAEIKRLQALIPVHLPSFVGASFAG